MAISTSPDSKARMQAELMSWVEVKDFFIGLRNDQVFFSYYRCQECELLYCPWYFSKDQIALLYAAMPDNTMGEDKSTVSRTQSAYANWIMSRKNTSNKRYLEVGPDIGLVANQIVKINKPEFVSFLEPNRSVRAELLESVAVVESKEVVDFIDELVTKEFSLIVGVHVYDHLLDPVGDLANLRTRVEIGASLSIVVHNESSLLRKLMGPKWPPFCLQHPQLFNPKTQKKLFAKSGWELLEVKRSTNWYHMKYFVSMVASILGLSTSISKVFPNIEFPIRLGNTISMAKAV
jgi:hypothetical protein